MAPVEGPVGVDRLPLEHRVGDERTRPRHRAIQAVLVLACDVHLVLGHQLGDHLSAAVWILGIVDDDRAVLRRGSGWPLPLWIFGAGPPSSKMFTPDPDGGGGMAISAAPESGRSPLQLGSRVILNARPSVATRVAAIYLALDGDKRKAAAIRHQPGFEICWAEVGGP